MSNFAPTKLTEQNEWIFPILLAKDIKTDNYGKKIQLIELNGEKMEWALTDASAAYKKLRDFNAGDKLAVTWFAGDHDRKSIVVDHPDDARVAGPSKAQPKAVIQQKVQAYNDKDDEKQRLIVRQSSIKAAVDLTVGLKLLKAEGESTGKDIVKGVLMIAKEFEAYVFGEDKKPAQEEEVPLPDLMPAPKDEPALDDIPW